MKRIHWVIIGLLVLSIALFGCAKEQTPPPDPNPPDGGTPEESAPPVAYSMIGNVFAVANEAGNRLITFTPIEDAAVIEGINVAMGVDGQYLNLEFVKKQDATTLDTGRITAANFDNMAGYVYNVLEQKVVPNQTYYLGKSEVIAQKSALVSSLSSPVALSTTELTAISDVKGRPAKEGWIMADYGDGMQLQIAVFEPQGQNYLMCMILRSKDGTLKFMDYAAVSDGLSVWRVDDGGTIDPAMFTIRLATVTDQGFLAVISWAGFEGENTIFLLEQMDALTEQPATAYRYWSPA